MKESTIKIEGMTCQHCVMRTKKAIDGVAGVTGSEVAVGSATVKFDETKTTQEAIEGAITKAGYKVVK